MACSELAYHQSTSQCGQPPCRKVPDEPVCAFHLKPEAVLLVKAFQCCCISDFRSLLLPLIIVTPDDDSTCGKNFILRSAELRRKTFCFGIPWPTTIVPLLEVSLAVERASLASNSEIAI